MALGQRVSKAGKEQFVLLPPPGQSFLVLGTNYLAVIGEGLNPSDNTRIGTNFSTYLLQTLGELPETLLGTLGPVDLISNGTLEGGASAAYHFDTVPGALGFWISLENRVGNPGAVSRGEIARADPGASGGAGVDAYGKDGGETTGLVAGGFRITVADPDPTETIMLKARKSGPGIRMRATRSASRRSFRSRSPSTAGSRMCSTRIRSREVTSPLMCCAARSHGLTNVTSGSPQLVVARDFHPVFLNTLGVNPNAGANWPSAGRWVAGRDWT